jgi:hypothetical protein
LDEEEENEPHTQHTSDEEEQDEPHTQHTSDEEEWDQEDEEEEDNDQQGAQLLSAIMQDASDDSKSNQSTQVNPD